MLLGIGSAGAQPAAPRAPEPGPPPHAAPEEARGWEEEPGVDPADVALFLPRVVLTPPRILVKALFWPVQKTLRFIERHKVIEEVEGVLYNDARTAGIVPTFQFLSSQGPSVGVSAFHSDLGGNDESVALSASFGGRYVQAYELGFEADHLLGTDLWLESLTRFEVNPRLLFQGYGDAPEASGGAGLGPRDAAVETRFRQTRLLDLLRVGWTFGDPGGEVKIGATGILNHRDFDPTSDDSEVSTETVYDTSRLPGFVDGVRTLEIDGNLVVDTRDVAGATASGLYLDLFGGGVPGAGDHEYVRYGGEVTGYVDLYKKTRVLVLRAVHEAVLGSEEDIPFSDLPRIGGPERLRGYALDRFRDRRTGVVTLEYHWPIHEYVAGALFVDAGQSAPTYRELARFSDWHVGGGGGVIIRSKNRVLFTFDVAYGDGLQLHVATDPLRAFADRSKQL